MTINMILNLIAGTGLFLYGMKMMSDGLAKAAGDKLRHFLEMLTCNRFFGVLVGIGFTVIIQSSSATTVMVVGFVNAGLLSLVQATGVIMGANIGTTITAQLIAFKLTAVAPLILLAGVVMVMFFKKMAVNRIGTVILGFGMLFVGLSIMGDAMAPLQEMPGVRAFMASFENPWIAMLAGLVLTAIIQSSSASVGMIQVLAGQGLVTLDMAVFMILGCNIGTCTDTLLASVGASRDARRTALVHLMFNVFGSILIGILLTFLPITDWMRAVTTRPEWQIANVHTLFKIIEVIVFFPLADPLVRLASKMVPGESSRADEMRLIYLDDRSLNDAYLALPMAIREVERLGKIAVGNLQRVMDAFFNMDSRLVEEAKACGKVIGYLNREITQKLVTMNRLDLAPADARTLGSLYHVVSAMERIGGHAGNMSESAALRREAGVEISTEYIREMFDMLDRTMALLTLAIRIFRSRDGSRINQVLEMKDQIGDMELLLQGKNVARLSEGLLSPQGGMLYSDIIYNLERVGDHAANIAISVGLDGGYGVFAKSGDDTALYALSK